MKHLRTSILVTVFWTLVVGGIYPLVVYGIGALCFPRQVEGSLVVVDGRLLGSSLVGQDFEGERYFHPRPSAIGYDASNSGASNWGWTSADLQKAYDQRLADWQKANGTTAAANPPPMDMLFASASGLDPHISPEAAEAQVPRVAAARQLSAEQTRALRGLVRAREEGPQLGFLGEPRVNVLGLNMDVDRAFPNPRP